MDRGLHSQLRKYNSDSDNYFAIVLPGLATYNGTCLITLNG